MNVSGPRPPHNEAERAAIADLIQRVFEEEATTRAHLAIVQSSAFDPASLPAIWASNGQPLAVVQAVPCRLALLGTWVAAGIITMVATDPGARMQGYMRACMEAAHEWLRNSGRPLAILYGVPQIYPRFDYRPVMPRSVVRYPTPAVGAADTLREACEGDVAAMASLFNQQEIQRPCSIERSAEQWVWRDGNPAAILDGEDGVSGYARIASPATTTLDVIECAARAGHEAELLDALHARAAAHGSQEIQLRLMPDHPLVQEVSRRATQLELSDVEVAVRPPQAGMLCVLDPGAVLELLQPEIERRLGGQGLRLAFGERGGAGFNGGGPTVRLPHQADLAHVLSGYPGVPALRQWGALQGDEPAIHLAHTAFPTAWPRWSYAPFWGE